MDTSHCRKCECKAFVPQYWKDNKCKECFHLILEHTNIDDTPVLSPKPERSDGSTPALSRRDNIVREILKTEQVYVENLAIMVDFYCMPLRAINNDIAPKDQLAIIFSNIEDIRPVNQTLLKDLQERINNWSPTQKIGDVFEKLIPFLKTYTKYTIGYAASIAALAECEKNHIFASILKKCSQLEKCKGLDLRSYLIQPVQRIPRYVLLLEDLLKNTDTSHVDYKDIHSALEKMKEIANIVNEAIRINENRIKVVQIQNCFINPIQDVNLVEPHRMFVREGSLTKICRKAPKKFRFVLFTDLLIYGSPLAGEKYLYHRSLSLDSCRLESISDTAQFQNAFMIGSTKKSFIVLAENLQEKESWMTDMQDQMKLILTRRQSFRGSDDQVDKAAEAPLWIPDQFSPNCSICSDEFTFFTRRHHCRACGSLVCASCSDQKVLILSIDTKSEVRVCDKCYKDKQKEETVQKGVLRTSSKVIMEL